MLVYQSGFGSPCRPCNRETFEQIAKSADVKGRVATAREFLAKGDHQGYDRTKRDLPGICFMANFAPNKGKEGKFREDTWRLQSAAKLTGLIMLDYDHIDFPARDVCQGLCHLLVAVADGLRLRCPAAEIHRPAEGAAFGKEIAGDVQFFVLTLAAESFQQLLIQQLF